MKHQYHFQISAGDDVPKDCQLLIIVSGGDVALTDQNNNTITYEGLPANTTFEGLNVKSVASSGTTATKIVGWS